MTALTPWKTDKSELTADGTVTFVGFPITSISKYIPETWEVKAIGEKCLSVVLPPEVFDPKKVESSLVDDFAHWKQSVPMVAAKKGSLKNDLKAGAFGDGGHELSHRAKVSHGVYGIGLHNRLTHRIHLQPFTLYECEQYARLRKLEMNRKQLMEAYMALGGVAYYWSLLDKTKSLALNMDELFFSRDGELREEYEELYASLYNHPDKYLTIIETLGKKKSGMTRAELVAETGLVDNGKLSEMLRDLENCGFIRKYQVIGKKSKGAVFQLVDSYTLFYFRFVRGNSINDEHFWSKSLETPAYYNWCGLAFERVCLLHSRQIKDKLGVAGIISNEYAWWIEGDEEHSGAQIDLLIDRNDGVINLCEMKYTNSPFKIDATYAASLQNKKTRFVEATETQKAIHITMISSQGIVRNAYSDEIQCQVTGNDLFRE